MKNVNHLADSLRHASLGREEACFARLPGGGEVSYGALWEAAGRMAGALIAMGVAPGDRVAVQAGKSMAALELYLGTVMAGAVYLPLNPAYTPAELEHFLTDAEPAVFVCDPAQAEAVAGLAARVGARLVTLDAAGQGGMADAAAAAAPAEPVARGGGDLAAILYTSGTTGRSKGAMLSHDNLLSNSATLRDVWRFTARDVLIHALPVYHTHGLFVATNVTLLAGGSVILHPKFEARAVLADFGRATAMMGVPTFYTRLLEEEGLTRAACAGMRLFVSGSAPLLAETHRRWSERTGHAILERYGMTETNMIASNPYEGERRPGTVGFALPGVALRVADAEGRPVAEGEIGIVEVSGPNVFKGYWKMPEKTAEEFRADGFFITGDMGMIDAEGYLHIVGRAKDLIISGGFNVYPKEVEDAIDAIPGVVESAVFGLPHPDFGEGVAAAIVAEPGYGLSAEAVRGALADRLARFKQPRHLVFLEALPRNAMGKVQKAALRAAHAGAFAG